MVTLAAVVLAAAAAALMAGPGRGRPAGRATSGPAAATAVVPATAAATVSAVAGLALAAGLLLDGTSLVLVLLAVGVGTAGLAAAARARRRRSATARRDAVIEVGEVVVAELRAGRPPADALRSGTETWPELAPAAVAARLGADVPAALHRLAALPGARGVHELASAWQVSERSGAPLADFLAEVVASARSAVATEHLVRAELASAQATARLVAVLPLAVLVMADGAGADPWAFLLGHPVGLACLGIGLALELAGLWWVDRVAASVLR